MCPVIEGADLGSVSTKYENWPEGAYKFTLYNSEWDGKTVRLKLRLREPKGDFKAGKEYTEFLNLKNNEGEDNEYGYKDFKRWFEALVPDHANDRPPNSDLLHGSDCICQVTIKTGTDGVERNKIKKIQRG